MKLKLLISPLAGGAFFNECVDVAISEFKEVLGARITDECTVQHERIGTMDFVNVGLGEDSFSALARLSFIQGAFVDNGEGGLIPLTLRPDFPLPKSMVFGWKYQGKTNELVTQLALNLALHHADTGRAPQTLLDPMAGKGTTLFWALQYGLNATGIEKDASALSAVHAQLKKQCKLHHIKHTAAHGSVGQKNKGSMGKFIKYDLAKQTFRLVTGDSCDAPELLQKQRFDIIVCDLPYGVQFKAGPKRSPLDTVAACAKNWLACLREGGAMALVFNNYQPKREELAALFSKLDTVVHPFSAPHRMSESIVRDILIISRKQEDFNLNRLVR
ncbi:MAG: hypothetical protein JXR76_25615 [Deltaproteobacteria bacterium]|nr:hypothetical protein [Deltaproteobacteria bacterium]